MFSKVRTINIVLACLLIFFVIKTYGVWKRGEDNSIGNQTVEKAKPHPQKRIIKRRLPSESHYRAVTERNLFSPDRAGFLPEETEPAPETELIKIPGKKITLYGVILTEDSATALVTNPEMKFGERRTIWVKAGDQLGSLKVTLIEKESISLTDGKKKYKILLYDQSKRKGRKAVAKKEEPTVVMTKSKQTKPKEPKQTKPEKQTHKELTNEQYEIINTPFGKMKRRKK